MTVSTENLRKTADFMQQTSGVDPTWLREAADEIERLRADKLIQRQIGFQEGQQRLRDEILAAFPQNR